MARGERQLYVGNLPQGLSNFKLVDLLNIAMFTLGYPSKEQKRPVTQAWISNDGHYAFVEFLTP